MGQIMKKTYHDTRFIKFTLSGKYRSENLDKDGYVVLQMMPVNETDVILEIIDKDKYESVFGK